MTIILFNYGLLLHKHGYKMCDFSQCVILVVLCMVNTRWAVLHSTAQSKVSKFSKTIKQGQWINDCVCPYVSFSNPFYQWAPGQMFYIHIDTLEKRPVGGGA